MEPFSSFTTYSAVSSNVMQDSFTFWKLDFPLFTLQFLMDIQSLRNSTSHCYISCIMSFTMYLDTICVLYCREREKNDDLILIAFYYYA